MLFCFVFRMISLASPRVLGRRGRSDFIDWMGWDGILYSIHSSTLSSTTEVSTTEVDVLHPFPSFFLSFSVSTCDKITRVHLFYLL